MSEILVEYASVLHTMRNRSVKSVDAYVEEYRRRFETTATAHRSGIESSHSAMATNEDAPMHKELSGSKLRDDILAAISVERRQRKIAETSGDRCTFHPELSPKAQLHQPSNSCWHERLHTDDVLKREQHMAEKLHQRAVQRQKEEDDELKEMARGYHEATAASRHTFQRLYLSGKQHEKWVEREQQHQHDLLAREMQKGQKSPNRNLSTRQGSVFDDLYNQARKRQINEQRSVDQEVHIKHMETLNRSTELRATKSNVSPSRTAELDIHQRLYNEATERQQQLQLAQEEQRAKSLEGLFQPNLEFARKESIRHQLTNTQDDVSVDPETTDHSTGEVPLSARRAAATRVSPPRRRELSPVVISTVDTLEVKTPMHRSPVKFDREQSNTKEPSLPAAREEPTSILPTTTPPAHSSVPESVRQELTTKEPPLPAARAEPTSSLPTTTPPAHSSAPESVRQESITKEPPLPAARAEPTNLLPAPVPPAHENSSLHEQASRDLPARKPRKGRTQEEQDDHDQRKMERRERREVLEKRKSDVSVVEAKKSHPPESTQRTGSPPKGAKSSPSLANKRAPVAPLPQEDVFSEPPRSEESFVRQSIDLRGIASSTATPEPSESIQGERPTSPPKPTMSLAASRKESKRIMFRNLEKLESITVVDSDGDSA